MSRLLQQTQRQRGDNFKSPTGQNLFCLQSGESQSLPTAEMFCKELPGSQQHAREKMIAAYSPIYLLLPASTASAMLGTGA